MYHISSQWLLFPILISISRFEELSITHTNTLLLGTQVHKIYVVYAYVVAINCISFIVEVTSNLGINTWHPLSLQGPMLKGFPQYGGVEMCGDKPAKHDNINEYMNSLN